MLVCVYTCQTATLLDITWHGSYNLILAHCHECPVSVSYQWHYTDTLRTMGYI